MESWNGAAGQVQLWKISGAIGFESMTSVGFPTSPNKWQPTSYNVSTPGGQADFAPQTGSTQKVQTNDDRITQVVFMNDSLWFTHEVFLPYSTITDASRVSIQWWQIDTLANLHQVGLIDDATNTNFYAFPTIAVNTNNQALIGFSHFSASIDPTASYAFIQNDVLYSVLDYRHGKNPYYVTLGGARNRWGDYSATMIDPKNSIDFWTIQETADTNANTWDTWWADVKPCNLPAATVTAGGPTSFCTGDSVTLSTITGTGYAYQWSAGGTAITGATNATYAATTTGSYTVVVTLSTCVSTSTATAVTANPAPTASITPVGATTVCAGGSVVMNAFTSAGYTYQWDVSGSPITGATNTSYTATTSGSYTLVVTSSGCSTTSTAVIVTVGTAPAVTATGATTFCSPGSVLLSTSGGVGLTFQWQNGTTAIAGATASTYTATASGAYSVIVTNTAGGCSTTSAGTTITAYAPPPAITGTPSVCVGAATPLSDGTAGGTWTTGAPSVASVSATGSVGGIAAGTATILYTIGGVCTTSVVVTVNTVTTAAISGPAIICIGSSVTYADVTAGGSWSSSSGSVATVDASSGVVTGLAAGSTTIEYSVTNPCGTSVATKTISVNGTPTTVAAIAGTFSICSGLATPLTDATPGGTWTSSNTSVATVSASGVVNGVSPGTSLISYDVTSAGGCVSSASAAFTVVSPLAATITPSGPTTFCSGGHVLLIAPSGPGFSYVWERGGAPIPGATLASYKHTTGGSYTVTITVSSGCVATSGRSYGHRHCRHDHLSFS